MKTAILYIGIAICVLLFASCNKEELLPTTLPEAELTAKARTVSLTAYIPEEDLATKVALTKDGGDISLAWQEGDSIDLAFVQEQMSPIIDASYFVEIKTVPVTNISANGKKATFEIALPDEITTGQFSLYGVYGGGGIGIDTDNGDPGPGPGPGGSGGESNHFTYTSNPYAILPSNPGSATSLNESDNNSIQKRGDVMLFFFLQRY